MKPKILLIKSGGDWNDASTDCVVNISDRSGEDLYQEYTKIGGYWKCGKKWFNEWTIFMGYCREVSDDELEEVYEI